MADPTPEPERQREPSPESAETPRQTANRIVQQYEGTKWAHVAFAWSSLRDDLEQAFIAAREQGRREGHLAEEAACLKRGHLTAADLAKLKAEGRREGLEEAVNATAAGLPCLC